MQSPIEVTDLGKFDYDGDDVLDDTAAPQIGIWDSSHALVVSTAIPTSTTPENGVFYAPITPTFLNLGTYVIGVQTFYDKERFSWDSNITTARAIQWNEGRFNLATTFTEPVNIRSQPTCYFGTNFKFDYLAPVESYVYDGSGQGAQPSSFLDTDGIELIDGEIPGTSYTDPDWVGFRDDPPDDGTSQPQVTFDLGRTYDLLKTTITYLQSEEASGTITAPEEVLISVSDIYDEAGFSTPVSFTGFDGTVGTEVRQAAFDLTGMIGRFVRLDFRNTSQWTFLGEVSFNGIMIPEPATLWSAVLGLLVLLSCARRRRSRE